MSDDKTMTAGDNPDDFTVDQVNAYLATVTDDAERARVLGAEQDGQARKGVLEGVHAAPTPDEPQEGTTGPVGDGGTGERIHYGSESNPVSAKAFQDAAKDSVEPQGDAYQKGYDGFVPSRDGKDPVDLTLAAVTGQKDS